MAASTRSSHDAVIDALMQELALRNWGQVSLADVAGRAGITLVELRGLFPSAGAILGAFARRIDQEALKGGAADLDGEPVREKLFDLLMRRLDAMDRHKAAIRNLRAGLRRDPFAARAWNRISVTSQQWTLAAAGVAESGPLGAAKAQMLALAFARVVDVWLDDEDGGQAKTLRALDRELGRLERMAGAASGLERLCKPFAGAFCRRPRGANGADLSEAAAI